MNDVTNEQLITYEIWVEGHLATGTESGAYMMGTSSGVDFHDACVRFMKKCESRDKYFDEELLTYWGSRLFDNQQDAIKSFG